jgi:hypothetical protein
MVRAAVGALFLLALYYIFIHRRADFVISVRGGSVQYRGALSLAVQQALTPFLLHDFGVQGPVRIMGARRGGRLTLGWRGRLTPGQLQRLRNFLLTRR